MTLCRGLRAFIVATIFIALLAALGVHSSARAVGAESTPGAAHPPATTPTPTVDRLAPPPTVENPTQADHGAQVYWLNCQPCHGDRGQGLTDEWRAQYPEDHQNCWTSGCHGERPYENGFTLPTEVPPVVGPSSLQRFEHMGLVHAYISAAMPYNAPGSLEEEEYLALAAFLAREHGVWDGTTIAEDNVSTIRLRPAALPTPTAPHSPATTPEKAAPATPSPTLWILAAVALIIVVVFVGWFWRWQRHT